MTGHSGSSGIGCIWFSWNDSRGGGGGGGWRKNNLIIHHIPSIGTCHMQMKVTDPTQNLYRGTHLLVSVFCGDNTVWLPTEPVLLPHTLEHTPLESCLYHRYSESFLSSLSELTDGYDNNLCLGTVCFIICFHILICNNSQWLTMYIHNGSLCIYTMAHYVYTQWLTMYIHNCTYWKVKFYIPSW